MKLKNKAMENMSLAEVVNDLDNIITQSAEDDKKFKVEIKKRIKKLKLVDAFIFLAGTLLGVYLSIIYTSI